MVVLAERVLVAFVVFVYDLPGVVHAHRHKRQGSDKLWPSRVLIHLPDLRTAGKSSVNRVLLDAGLEKNPAPFEDAKRSLVAWIVSQPLRRATFSGCDEYVLGTSSVGREYNLFPVRGPKRIRVIGLVGRDLKSPSTVHSNGEYVTLIAKRYLATVR